VFSNLSAETTESQIETLKLLCAIVFELTVEVEDKGGSANRLRGELIRLFYVMLERHRELVEYLLVDNVMVEGNVGEEATRLFEYAMTQGPKQTKYNNEYGLYYYKVLFLLCEESDEFAGERASEPCDKKVRGDD